MSPQVGRDDWDTHYSLDLFKFTVSFVGALQLMGYIFVRREPTEFLSNIGRTSYEQDNIEKAFTSCVKLYRSLLILFAVDQSALAQIVSRCSKQRDEIGSL